MLTHRITIYVPCPPEKIDHHSLPKQIAVMLSDAAGGATVTEGQGHWRNDEGQMIVEPVALVTAFYEGSSSRAMLIAVGQACDLLKSVGEQSVAIETEKGMVIL